MRNIIAITQVTLDGVMQSPGGPEEDPRNGFTHGGWAMPFVDDAGSQAIDEIIVGEFDMLLGRRTYEIFAAYWPNQGDDNPIAKAFNKATKYVVTRSLDHLDWETSLRQIRSAGLRMFSRSCSARIVGKPSLTVWLEFAKRVRPSVRPQKLSRYWPR